MSMDVAESTTNGSEGAFAPATISLPARRQRAGALTDGVYHGVTLVVSLGMVVVLGAIVILLLTTAWPAITRIGPGFLVGTVWNTGIDVYGALPFIAGTLITTALALLIAVPVSLLSAIFLTEYAPRPVAAVLGVIVDVAAGVPTVVFGTWALLVVAPWMQTTVEPAIAAALGWLPLFDANDIHAGYGMLSAGLVLAAMIFPTIVVVTRNALLATPIEMRESSLGLGATRWETATRVMLRQARAGTLGAVILACGRALGETLAVVYIIGQTTFLPHSLFDKGNTLSAQLLTQVFLSGAVPGSLYAAALYELGVVLLALSLLTSLAGRVLTRRLVGAAALPGIGR